MEVTQRATGNPCRVWELREDLFTANRLPEWLERLVASRRVTACHNGTGVNIYGVEGMGGRASTVPWGYFIAEDSAGGLTSVAREQLDTEYSLPAAALGVSPLTAQRIHAFAESYTLHGEYCHNPTQFQRMLIEDALLSWAAQEESAK